MPSKIQPSHTESRPQHPQDLLASCNLCAKEMARHYPWQLWCHNCQARLPGMKLAVKLGLVLGISMAFLANGPAQAVLILSFVLALTVAACVDTHIQSLPDDVTLPLLWLGLLSNWAGVFVPLTDAVMGAALGYVSLWSLYWGVRLATRHEALGHGDFKLTAALCAWLGVQALPAILIGSALVHTVMSLALRWRKPSADTLPFGPALAIAGIGGLVWRLAPPISV